MDAETIRALIALNNGFYRDNHETFSRSRQAPWPGWRRVGAHLPVREGAFRLLDVACGNMRFERFLIDAFPQADLAFTCLDASVELAQSVAGACFIQRDVISELAGGGSLVCEAGGRYDAAVSFGFMHHIPSVRLRERFAGQLAASVRPGGLIALSFWKFMDDPRMEAQARRVTEEFQQGRAYALDLGDYILGWNGVEGAYRYCHHFTSGEVDAIAQLLARICDVEDRFCADGRNSAMNEYLVLRRRM